MLVKITPAKAAPMATAAWVSAGDDTALELSARAI